MLSFLVTASSYAIPLLMAVILGYALWKRVPLFETFVEGAKEGALLTARILPFLLGMLVAIHVFRESGAFDALLDLLRPLAAALGLSPEVLPLGLLRPLSGSGALGLTADLLSVYGPDSFIGRLASVVQGSTDTTFYILAVYFGSVGITRSRHALFCGLTADFAAFLAANFLCLLVFGR